MVSAPINYNGLPLGEYLGGFLTPAGNSDCCCLNEWEATRATTVQVIWSVALNRYIEQFGTCSDGGVNWGDGRLSRSDTNGERWWARVQFGNVTIPQGATILSAEMELAAADLGTPTGCICDILIPTQLSGHSPGCTPTWGGEVCFEYSAQQCLTSASQSWSAPMLHSDCGRSSIIRDVTTIVQEIVNDGDWNSGDTLKLYMKGNYQPDCEENCDIQVVQGSGPYIVVLSANTVNAHAGDKLHDEMQRTYQIVNIQGSLIIVSDAYGMGVPPSTGPFQAWIEYAISPACNRPNDCISWAERGSGWAYNTLGQILTEHVLRAQWVA